jgi:hypothetical protein
MKNILRGMALSVMVYCVVTGITLVCVKLCGGRISDITTDVYVGIGVVCGFIAIMINEKLD